ncbi:hypothetical protein [Sandarakinorhabdus sp.]|uniref:hypothetical protein n=1 Tax=Sandarakinorhabdus sp. TaxID=1916663 RepID=UPI00333FE56C
MRDAITLKLLSGPGNTTVRVIKNEVSRKPVTVAFTVSVAATGAAHANASAAGNAAAILITRMVHHLRRWPPPADQTRANTFYIAYFP